MISFRTRECTVLAKAASEAGIDTYHGTVKCMMENRHYLGDNFYLAIIDKEIFESAAAKRIKRADKFSGLNYKRVIKPSVVPTHFHLSAAIQHYDDPRLQEKYLYSLIESEAV